MEISDERLSELAGPVDFIEWTPTKLLHEANELARLELERRKARKEGDTMQLTPEQLEKTARIAYETWYEGDLSWGEGSEVYKEDMRKAIAAAFAAVEPPQVEVPVVLMPNGERVALEDPRVLGDVTYEERKINQDQSGFIPHVTNTFLASRRTRLLETRTVEERVTIEIGDSALKSLRVLVDGKLVAETFAEYGESVRLAMIAKLKAEGTVSGETGGNAQ